MEEFIFKNSIPEKQGVNSADLIQLVDGFQKLKYMHHFTIIRNDNIIAKGSFSPYQRELKHHLFSGTKSFLSVAIGLCYDDKLISLDDKIMKFFPDIEVSGNRSCWEEVTVRNLLTMSSGHGCCPALIDGVLVKKDLRDSFFEAPLLHKAGEYFAYNSNATYILSEIIQIVTNKTTEELLKERILSKLGITDINFLKTSRGITIAGVGAFILQDDWIKFGKLLIDNGVWNGEQLISKEYLDMATSMQIDNSVNTFGENWQVGYGFQFWQNKMGGYRADGAAGQFLIILKEYNLVIAINSGLTNMSEVMDLIEEHLVSKIDKKSIELPENNLQYEKLNDTLATLKLPTISNEVTKLFDNVKFIMSENEQNISELTLNSLNDELLNLKVLLTNNREISLNIAMNDYSINDIEDFEGKVRKFGINGGFTSENQLFIRLFDLNNIYNIEYTIEFENNKLSISRYCPLFIMDAPWTKEINGVAI